jgi:hypothetical protein
MYQRRTKPNSVPAEIAERRDKQNCAVEQLPQLQVVLQQLHRDDEPDTLRRSKDRVSQQD